MATCEAIRTAILGSVLAAIDMVSLRPIPVGILCPIRKVTCLVVGRAIADAVAEATLGVKWVRTCGGTLRATPIATSAATCAAGLGREPGAGIRRQAFGMEREWRRVCKPSSVPGLSACGLAQAGKPLTVICLGIRLPARLKRPTRELRWTGPVRFSYWSCTRQGFSIPHVATRDSALLPHFFTLTASEDAAVWFL
jgi:hypothetical protein